MTFKDYDLYVIANNDGFYIDEFYGNVYLSEGVAQLLADEYNHKHKHFKHGNSRSAGFAEVMSIDEFIESRISTASDYRNHLTY